MEDYILDKQETIRTTSDILLAMQLARNISKDDK